MRLQTKHKHMIDFLFPVALFFVFALSSLTVVLLAAGIYQSTTEDSALNDTARTSLSYITEKIHQNDTKGMVSLGTFDGCDALVLQQTYNDENYYTYIYAYENELKELFIKDGANATASDGKAILQVKDFSIELVNDQLLKFQCVDKNDRTASVIVGLRSQ
ncbi:DUF4860 domain-containing protein [Faecalicatena contorta]|uniref:DUF4860 domain-containing protein n=1 Tax=Faecalicatena contorta TaxID=39482 RepID=UPI001F33D781|nr:DUF4860 domain-containing protein [Faecalicatena contorta]MCF2680611.1 DUF4860 domain-containing protein [Faecalicatena contorta]